MLKRRAAAKAAAKAAASFAAAKFKFAPAKVAAKVGVRALLGGLYLEGYLERLLEWMVLFVVMSLERDRGECGGVEHPTLVLELIYFRPNFLPGLAFKRRSAALRDHICTEQQRAARGNAEGRGGSV
eukprot:397338-Pleurochrysis_carterae.AAC.5